MILKPLRLTRPTVKSLRNLRVAAEDRGKVIGRKGRTAHAIRTLIAAATMRAKPSLLSTSSTESFELASRSYV